MIATVLELKRYGKEEDLNLHWLIVTMVAAQKLNQHSHPIYGAYIVGQHWYLE